MYEKLRDRIAGLLLEARPLKPQTERQLAHHLSEHHADVSSFLLCAAEVLEDHELDILFSPHFTPSLDDRIVVMDLLLHWRPSENELNSLVDDLCEAVPHAMVQLPDGTEAKLTTHEVMIERFVRLLRLHLVPDATTSAALRDSLPNSLWAVAGALLCQRGFTAERQEWFARFVDHVASVHAIDREYLETAAGFIADQQSLDPKSLTESIAATVRAAEGAVAYARGGHTYWSPDVAEHHHYRGQGNVDKDLVQQRQEEADWLHAIQSDLKSFVETEDD